MYPASHVKVKVILLLETSNSPLASVGGRMQTGIKQIKTTISTVTVPYYLKSEGVIDKTYMLIKIFNES